MQAIASKLMANVGMFIKKFIYQFHSYTVAKNYFFK